jgi:hypothetical protein
MGYFTNGEKDYISIGLKSVAQFKTRCDGGPFHLKRPLAMHYLEGRKAKRNKIHKYSKVQYSTHCQQPQTFGKLLCSLQKRLQQANAI